MSLDLPLSRLLSIDSVFLCESNVNLVCLTYFAFGSVDFCKKKDLSVSKSQQLNVGGAD